MSNNPEDWFMEEENASISFQSEDVAFELSSPEEPAAWIRSVIEREGHELHEVCFIFCSDEYLYNLNQEYLNHDTYTDIITFPYSEPPLVEGDIFISIDRVKENASQFGAPFEQELHRVMIHGVLHLCGYSDKSPDEEALMRKKEDEALQLL